MIKNYLKIAWRNLVKNKTYTFINIIGLSIGVAVCLCIGLWLKREISFDNFHSSNNDIFRIVNTFKSESETFSQAPSGIALGAQLPKQLPAIKSACRVFNVGYKFKAGNNQYFESQAYAVDSNFFSFFKFRLIEGNPSTALNSPDKVVLSRDMAIKYFGTINHIAGRTILVDDQPMTVGGVAENPPANTHLQYNILVPYDRFRQWAIKNWKSDPDNEWVGGWPYVYVKLSDPTIWKTVEKQVNNVVARFSEKDWKANKMTYQYFLQPIHDIHLKSHLRYDAANNGSVAIVNIFSIAGLVVLLLACINYINFTTAGAIKRAKETSVKKVVGATRSQLVVQFFIETFLICTMAVVLGIVVLQTILPSFSAFIGQQYNFKVSLPNILVILVFILSVSAIAGIYPSVILSSFKPVQALKGTFSQSKTGNLIRKGLVIFQFTITIALVASILVITRQMNFIKNSSLGFNSNAVIEVNFNGEQNVDKRYNTIRNELMKDVHIINVSRHQANVVGGLGNGWTTTENLQGQEISTSIYRLNVDADYFSTYGLKLAAGRFFSRDITTDSSKAVMINESAVKTFGWKKPEDAIGKPFGKGDRRKYVVGVLKNFNFESLHKPVDALLIGYADNWNSISLKMDASHINEAIGHLNTVWKNVVPEVPLQYSFVDQRIARQYSSEQKMENIFYVFSGLSLLIACLGLFGLSIFIVERKIKEIGIRKVLGASISGIVGLLSADFIKLVILSMLVATPLAWYFMHNWLNDFAYHVSIGWWVFLAAGAIAMVIAVLTISIQTIKAALANPVRSLRSE